MPTTTTTYSFNKPVVGADEDSWGGYLNGNWDSVDDLLDGTTPITGIDINSGTIDNVVIGGATPAAGTFTTLTANTSITGTLATAAQPNITSVGTLTGLTVSASASLAGASTTADITFGDNDKAIFGAGSDLQIYHDGAGGSSYITESGAGSLYIQGTNLRLQSATGEQFLTGDANNNVKLYYDNSERIATTSTGIDVTGTVTADGLTVDNSTSGQSKITISEGGVDNRNLVLYSPATGGTNGKIAIEGTTANLDFVVNNGSQTAIRIGGSTGDISFYEDTGTTAKFFWDASAESLGIGTSSPNRNVEVSSLYDTTLRLASTRNTNSWTVGDVIGQVEMYSADGTAPTASVRASVAAVVEDASGSSTGLAFRTYNNTERMRIDSSGNVGIGTSSPSRGLHVNNNGESFIRITSSDTGNAGIEFGDQSDGVQGAIFQNSTDNSLRFNGYNNSERMRIDSSGNLLVSTTGSTPATGTNTGIALKSNDTIEVGTSGAAPLLLNRTSNDGNIAVFRKDGTTVGNIGNVGANVYIASQGAAKYVLYNSAFAAFDDNSRDLGLSSQRFKDLYLSGGVYLGGTGSANKMSDYEEGSWTPTFTSWTTNPTSASGRYTKIGRLVLITFKAIGGAKTSATSAYIEGLPFAIEGSGAVGSVSNSGVSDYGNVLFQNTDRMWFTNNSFSATWYASGVYETTA